MKIGGDVYICCRMIEPIMRGLRTRTPQFAGMKPEDRVLDVCCGAGAQTLRYTKIGINAYGVDLDPRKIEFAEKKRRKQRFNNASFQIASAMDLPFEDSYFNCASICLALHEKNPSVRDTIITEMKRVVKENGTLVFIDYRTPMPRTLSAYFSKFLEFAAGKNHYAYFKDYTDRGGLEPLPQKNHLQLENSEYLGPLVAIRSTNAKG